MIREREPPKVAAKLACALLAVVASLLIGGNVTAQAPMAQPYTGPAPTLSGGMPNIPSAPQPTNASGNPATVDSASNNGIAESAASAEASSAAGLATGPQNATPAAAEPVRPVSGGAPFWIVAALVAFVALAAGVFVARRRRRR